ncbi:DMT family transporter [Sphingomonas sp. ID0503]|uniref:DMT family transporter n=1 Tax=Sphingomonas sp. ID0503 TaxID=3399691 RepID=UPI003AFB2942
MSTRPATAFLAACLGIAVFACMDAVMKHLVLAAGVMVVILWRAYAGVVLSGVLYAAQRPGWPARAALRIHAIRGVLASVLAILFFWGLARVPIAQAVALAFVAPLVAVALGALILKERVGRAAVFGSCLAFGGVLVVMLGQRQGHYGHEAFLGAIAVLASAVMYGLNLVIMRQQAQVAGPVEVAFFQNLAFAICTSLAIPFMGDWIIDPRLIGWVVAAAAMATTSAMLLSWAYGRAEAGYLSASEYTAFIWGSALGYLVFGERLTVYTLAGAAFIILGCLIVTRRKIDHQPQIEGVL